MAKLSDYDDGNLWHSHFFVMLQARCASCNMLADTADLYAKRRKSKRDGALEIFCVEATERLSQRGWFMPDEHRCYCPECWAKLKSKAVPNS